MPTALFTGGQDWLADPQDVAGLIPKINSTGKVFYRKNIDKYDHLDFIWGMDAATLVYHEIVEMALKMLNWESNIFSYTCDYDWNLIHVCVCGVCHY